MADDHVTTATAINATSTIIGYAASKYYGGFLDEVKIYPYARTADQIKQDYAAGLAGISVPHGVSASFGSLSDSWMTDGLVGYWKMDETATTSARRILRAMAITGRITTTPRRPAANSAGAGRSTGTGIM